MKFIDILSDKIDYLFRRSKTADERTYDFFIRTVTFLILALIILCYGSFVHASENYLISYYDINVSELNNSSTLYLNNTDYSHFMNIKLNTNNVSYSVDFNANYTINDFLYLSDMPSLSDNYVMLSESTAGWYECWFIPKNYIDSGDMVLTLDTGGSARIFSKVNYTFTVWYVYYNQADDPEQYRQPTDHDSQVVAGGSTTPSDYNPAWQHRLAFSNAPVIYVNRTNETYDYNTIMNFVDNGSVDDYPNIWNCNYYTFTDDLLVQPWDDVVPVEGANNHLYLEDFQIGLSATTNLADLMSSDVIIGISGDDYIQNHPDEFEIWIDYHVMLKDSITGISDPDVHYSYYYPARTFLNGVYSMGINEIFEHMTLSNNTSLYNYYRNLKDTYNQKVVADGQTFVRGLFPDLYKTLWEHYIGGYYVDNAVTTNNTIFNFDFEVSVAIRESGSNNISGIGTKKFDFLNGTESITTASVLQNHDPWEGESDPQMSPAVPSTGSSISSGSGGGGNVNVKVDVSGQKIPLGVKTKAQMEEILQNYRDVYGEFDSNWYTLADENDDNNFLKILGLTLPEIPAMDYMVKCACVIFGLAVVLFVLKVLLF